MYLPGKINHRAVIDLLVILFTGVILVTYDYRKDMLPDGLLFSVQLCAGWFLFRILYARFPSFPFYTCVGILLFGLVEAVWGLAQLYDFSLSRHRLFKTTGSFLNPGPYGGLIALMFPLVLHYWLSFKQRKRWAGYLFLFAGAVCMMIFPATLSRAAWVAAVAGCLLVLMIDTRIIVMLRILWRRRERGAIIATAVLCILLAASIYGFYYLGRGLEISCDPMFYNVKGRNHYEMREYNKAGDCYINSTWLLPERVYPYFLLTKLYADPANYQPEKMIRAANAVLQKEPKVHSMAVMEMRDEVRKILKEKGAGHE